MNNTYIAITIGPIYKTFYEAKKTRSVWAASYFFSWFARTILEKAMCQNMSVFLPDTSLMTSQDGCCKGVKGEHGAGLYADRLYFNKDENTSKEKLQEIIKSVIAEVEQKSGSIPVDFLENYLNIHIVEKEITDLDLKVGYPLEILNKLLDNKELHQNYNFDFKKNELQSYFLNKTNASENFLSGDAFGEKKERMFRSISEIATTSLGREIKTKKVYGEAVKDSMKRDEAELMDILVEEKKLELKPFHKYFAVLYADGDEIGKMLKEINSKNKDIKLFSKALFEFGLEAEKIISVYGGNAIYMGGEDILAFVPVACISEQNKEQLNIFTLIKQLDISFDETVLKFAKENDLTQPTMSYGIMMAYYKYPLKEAMHKAHKLLVEDAKTNGKNAIAFCFQKHSGQRFECKIEKVFRKSLQAIYQITEAYSKLETEETNKSFEILSSIIQRFRDDSFTCLYMVAAKNQSLDSFFKNFFNEDIHKDTPKAVFLEAVKTFSEIVIDEYKEDTKSKEVIYTVLRFIHFINSKKE